jgi:hypothetical protein
MTEGHEIVIVGVTAGILTIDEHFVQGDEGVKETIIAAINAGKHIVYSSSADFPEEWGWDQTETPREYIDRIMTQETA